MEATWYEIRVQGTLSPEWTEWFGGMSIRPAGGGETVMTGWIADQPALHGCLARIRDLNLRLLSVNPVVPPDSTPAQREIPGG